MTQTINPPRVAPPQTGIVEVARKLGLLTEDTTHQEWEIGGFRYRPIAAGPGGHARSVLDYDNAGDDVYSTPGDADPRPIVTAYPFLVEAVEGPVSAFGWKADNYIERAEMRLAALQSKIIERELWAGEVAQLDSLDPDIYSWLAQDTANGTIDLTPGGGAVPTRDALALLEEAIGNAGNGVGTLHFPKRAAIMMPDRWAEGPIVTWPDSSVVAGAGYPGTGPGGDDPDDGEQWIYATDPVIVRLGPVEVFPPDFNDAVDPRKNTIEFRAQRTAAVAWDGNSHFAIRTTVSSS